MSDAGEPRGHSVADLAILEELFRERRGRLLAMLRWRIGPASSPGLDPEDLLNEAFLRAWRRWPTRGPGALSPYPWLYRIVLDCLVEAWRRLPGPAGGRPRELPLPEHSSAQLVLGLVGSGTSPSQAMARLERAEALREALRELSTRDQEILWMRHREGWSFKEAADVLGITENAATVRYHRALGRLEPLVHALGLDSEPEP